jgi:hypothetical protein
MRRSRYRRGRIARHRLTALIVVIGALSACGGSTVAATSPPPGASATLGAAQVAGTAPLVGRWMQIHTCAQLVAGLEEADLGATAPAMVVDFFPQASVKELAAKDDLCSGARPQRHFHFFDAVGSFGSLDQDEQQVDDGKYAIDGGTLQIGDGAWRFTISNNQLTLEPMITDEQITEALADPSAWSVAGWVVAVAYPPSTWRRVPCRGWC